MTFHPSQSTWLLVSTVSGCMLGPCFSSEIGNLMDPFYATRPLPHAILECLIGAFVGFRLDAVFNNDDRRE